MGLDQYIRKGKRIPKISWEEYKKIDRKICNEEKGYEKLVEKYKEFIHECGTYTHWNSLFEEVGYLRKANQIHNWFVNNVQDGCDDCEMYKVSKIQLETLLDTINVVLVNSNLVEGEVETSYTYDLDGTKISHMEKGKVIENSEVAQELLPTQSGFFFGNTNYDEWYYNDLVETKNIIEKILRETDFNKEYIVYESSW